jgi:hypothetical protein
MQLRGENRNLKDVVFGGIARSIVGNNLTLTVSENFVINN